MHERMRARMFGKELIVRTLTGVPQRLPLYSLFCFNPLIGGGIGIHVFGQGPITPDSKKLKKLWPLYITLRY